MILLATGELFLELILSLAELGLKTVLTPTSIHLFFITQSLAIMGFLVLIYFLKT